MIHQMMEEMVLNLSNHETLGENNKRLGRALNVQNSYVDALNIMQAETLKQVHHAKESGMDESQALKNGIMNGMGKTVFGTFTSAALPSIEMYLLCSKVSCVKR